MGGNSGTARKFPGIGVYRIRTGVCTGDLSDFPSKTTDARPCRCAIIPFHFKSEGTGAKKWT